MITISMTFLMRTGVLRKPVKMRATEYSIQHTIDSLERVTKNLGLLKSVVGIAAPAVFSFEYSSDPSQTNDIIGIINSVKNNRVKIKVLGYRYIDFKIGQIIKAEPKSRKHTPFSRRRGQQFERYSLALEHITDIKPLEHKNIALYINFQWMSKDFKEMFSKPVKVET